MNKVLKFFSIVGVAGVLFATSQGVALAQDESKVTVDSDGVYTVFVSTGSSGNGRQTLLSWTGVPGAKPWASQADADAAAQLWGQCIEVGSSEFREQYQQMLASNGPISGENMYIDACWQRTWQTRGVADGNSYSFTPDVAEAQRAPLFIATYEWGNPPVGCGLLGPRESADYFSNEAIPCRPKLVSLTTLPVPDPPSQVSETKPSTPADPPSTPTASSQTAPISAQESPTANPTLAPTASSQTAPISAQESPTMKPTATPTASSRGALISAQESPTMKSRSAGAATLPKAFKGARPIGQVDPDLIFTAIIVAILATIPTALIAQVASSDNLSVHSRIKKVIGGPINAIEKMIGSLLDGDQRAWLRRNANQVWSAEAQSFIGYGAFVMVILSSLLVALWDGASEGLTAAIAVALTALLGFLVLDVTSIKIGWSLSGSTRPLIFASKPLFLALITMSLVISWALDLASPIIFAALLVPLPFIPTEVGSSQPSEADRSQGSAGDPQEARFKRFSLLTLLSIGLLAWGCYTFLWYQPQPTSLANLFMWISAALTCQALATLPLTLLPVRFLPGQQIFKEKFTIWILLFLASLIMFAIAFLPENVTPMQLLPGDLGRESVSVDAAGPWQAALIAYCVLGVLIWLAAYFWPREKPSATPLESVTNGTP